MSLPVYCPDCERCTCGTHDEASRCQCETPEDFQLRLLADQERAITEADEPAVAWEA